jgi:hypothetical protein
VPCLRLHSVSLAFTVGLPRSRATGFVRQIQHDTALAKGRAIYFWVPSGSYFSSSFFSLFLLFVLFIELIIIKDCSFRKSARWKGVNKVYEENKIVLLQK